MTLISKRIIYTCYIQAIIIATVFIYGCGNPVTPTGGPKDTTAPKLLTIKIDSTTTDKTVELKFNENISIKSQIVISPLGKTTTDVKRNSIQIQVPNTTRTIYLKNKIIDLNESNPYNGNNISLTKDSGSIQLINKTKNTKLTIFIESDSLLLLPNNLGNYYKFENLKKYETTITIINKDNNNYSIDKNEEFLKITLESHKLSNSDTIEINHLIPQIKSFQDKKEILPGIILKTKSIRSYTTNEKNKNILYQNDSCIEYQNIKNYTLKPGRAYAITHANDTTYLREKYSTNDSVISLNSPILYSPTDKPVKEKIYTLGKLKINYTDTNNHYYIYLRNNDYQFLLNITSEDSIYLPTGNYQCIASLIPFDEISKDYQDNILLYHFKEDIIINSKLENNLILPKKELFNIGITYR